METQRYRPDIDGLRMVAVTSVVLCHAGTPFFGGGFVGVDVFFVISGYLITQIIYPEIDSGRFSLIAFYERRVRRLFPALVVVLLVSFLAAWILLLPPDFKNFAGSSVAATMFVANFWFLFEAGDYFAVEAELRPLLHTWSLAVEEQFYIFYPFILGGIVRWAKNRALLVLSILSAISFVAAAIGVALYPPASFYLAPLRAWELGLGAILALSGPYAIEKRWIRECVALAGVAAIALAVVFYSSATPFPGISALAPCLGAAALILVGSAGGSVVTRALSSPPAVFVGLISYSLYLWHWPILAFTRHFRGDVDLPPGLALAAVIASVAAAAFSWAFIETPFRKRSAGGFRRSTVFALSAAWAGLILAISGVSLAIGGTISRFSPALNALAEAPDPEAERCHQRLPSEGLCTFGSSKPSDDRPDFILWGDSHARAAFAGVDKAAERAGKTGFYAGMGACPPLLDVRRADMPATHQCDEFNREVMDFLEARDDAPLVILSARWALAAEGERTGADPGPPARLEWSEAAPDLLADTNFEIFKESLIRTVGEILKSGRRVVILGPTPEFDWNSRRALVSHFRWGEPMPPPTTIDDVIPRQARVESVFRRLEEMPGVRVVRITPLVCTPECAILLGSRPVYDDDDHLSVTGSEHFIAGALGKDTGRRIYSAASVSSARAWSSPPILPFNAL
ncbi:MAG: acyltransferase, partial [Rhodospirillales bacterium]|nr:acyltransferase [Rhodospirillales bacterium]